MPKIDAYDHFFLGPKSELRTFLKEVIDLAVDDYIFWRRNYHPKDPPAISYQALHTEEADVYRGRFHQELFELVSDLKLDVPFFSPRYMAHMVSEVAVPGLVAYLATMLYNPNNVSQEASPVTARFELEVGRQLATLFGYPLEDAFGHLCSGGTIANYESLWLNRAGKFLPVAIHLACDAEKVPKPEELPSSLWELLNLPLDRVRTLYQAFMHSAAERALDAQALLRRWDIGAFGDADYRTLVQERFGVTYASPAVLVPATAHYCWSRSAGLLGYGRNHLLTVPVDAGFHMKPEAFRTLLERCRTERRPVLQSVFVLGTTEHGAVDPLPELLAVREQMRARGLETAVHVDAAYGGYFASIFQGEARCEADRAGSTSPEMGHLLRACAMLEHTDSITVDPHKMGYAPYGAGAVVVRHGFLRRLVAEGAAYALDTAGGEHEDLGRFILEGSKPGAAAAAVWFNHRMMPLAADGYGSLLLDLCRLAHTFYRAVQDRRERLDNSGAPVTLVPLAVPETNIVCLLIVPRRARSLAEVDRLNRRLAVRFGVRDVDSIQSYDYLVSKTRIPADMPAIAAQPQLAGLKADADTLTCLRLVFMNRWVAGETQDGTPFIEDFLDTLVREAEGFLPDGGEHPVAPCESRREATARRP